MTQAPRDPADTTTDHGVPVALSELTETAAGTFALSRSWPFRGGGVRDIGSGGQPVGLPLQQAAADEVVARVDAVCICSSDIKIIRMGAEHPLLQGRDLSQTSLVLGHEVALTVTDVGADWRGIYRPGQRLGLQPAITREGRRTTIGMDLPGGFSQHIRLDAHVLAGPDPYVFTVPDTLSAASVAMLEPYSCVEAAYRRNSRISLQEGGRLLILGGPGADAMTLSLDVRVREAVLLRPPAGLADWARDHAGLCTRIEAIGAIAGSRFDDIVLCGDYDPALVQALLPVLADGGLLAVVAADATRAPVTIDAARLHYRRLSVVGAVGPRVDDAFDATRNRYELRAGGTLLVLGAGGAMGRIHVHRALQMADGPGLIIATSRKGARLEGLERDFASMARAAGRRLVVLADTDLDRVLPDLAPGGCDDVAVVAPEVEAVERGARCMRPDGMLVIFAGMPFGKPCRLPLGLVASHGARFTGSTGSEVEDQRQVLRHIEAGRMELSDNLEAVAGFDALPDALEAVSAGAVSGKIAIYPFVRDLPLTPLRTLSSDRRAHPGQWSRADEEKLKTP